MVNRTSLARIYGEHWLKENERYKKLEINDIPIMRGIDGSIICIPKRNEVFNVGFVAKRGRGKCEDENEEIFTKEGIKKIKDIKIGDEVISFNRETLKVEYKKIIGKEKIIKDFCLRLITKSKEESICSEEHKFLVINNSLEIYEKQANDINPKYEYLLKSEKITFKAELDNKDNYVLDWDFGYLIGIYLAEGSLNKNGINIDNMNPMIKKYVEIISKKRKLDYHVRDRKCWINNKELRNWIKNNFSSGSANKLIPLWSYNSNINFIKGLISGYLDGDGCLNEADCGFVSKSKDLAYGMERLLLCLGINSKVKKIKKKYDGEYREYFLGDIININRLKENIILLNEKKDNELKRKNNSRLYFLPYLGKKIDKDIFKKNARFLSFKNCFEYKSKSIFYKDFRFSKINEENCIKNKIIEIMKNNQEFTVDELANKLNIDKKIIYSVIRNLYEVERIINKVKKKMTRTVFLQKYNVYSLKEDWKGIQKKPSPTTKKVIELLQNGSKYSTWEISNKLGTKRDTISNIVKKEWFKKEKQKREREMKFHKIAYSLNKENFDKSIYKNKVDKSLIKKRILNMIDSEIFACEIEKIEKVEEKKVMYHLEVEDNHNFMLANTIITCNSLLAHSLTEVLFWQINNIAIMNDSLEETYDWTKPQNNPEWIEQLNVLGQVPCPLPLIFVYQNTNTLSISEEHQNYDYVKVSLPFSELIENSEKYLDMGKSAIYLRKLKDELLECDVPQEVFNLIEEKKDIPPQSKHKILTSFDTIFSEEILNITNQEIPSQLNLNQKYTNNPFSVIMKAGCIPSFVTSDLYTRRYKAEIFAYYINLLFQNQFSREFLNETLYLFFDEITKICSTEEQNAAREALEQIPARGRQMRVGLIYCTQNYEKIPRVIQSNTDYIFAFRHSSHKEVAEIAKDFDVPEHIEKEMLNLDKFECIGLTSDTFKIYKDGEIIESDEPVKGTILFPNSRHKKPQN